MKEQSGNKLDARQVRYRPPQKGDWEMGYPWIIRGCHDLDEYERRVLSVFVEVANRKTGHCYPSIKTIGEKARCGKTKVRAAIAVLEEKGLITVLQRGGFRGGKNRANSYQVEWGNIRDRYRNHLHEIGLHKDADGLEARANGAVQGPRIVELKNIEARARRGERITSDEFQALKKAKLGGS